MKKQNFDTVVVGSGTSAYFAVDGLLRHGQQVALIDERPFGGTCALRGCQPKKYLVSNVEAVALASQLEGQGLTIPPQTDWQALQILKNRFLEGRPEAELRQWQKKGVTTFQGRAVMSGTDRLTVNNTVLTADNIVLATGAIPRRSTIPGADYLQDSEAFLNLAQLPKRILFIGGGYISFEFAHVAIRAGAEEVTILHRSALPLKSFDQDCVQVLLTASRALGIRVLLNQEPTAVEMIDSGYLVHGKGGQSWEADCIIEASGRVPNLEVLAGGEGKVDADRRGILVTPYLQSVSNPRVYAIGDCAATGSMLAPVADREGQVVVANILGERQQSIDYAVVPSVVFTIPPMGSVGLTEQQAREQGLEFRSRQGSTSRWPSSLRIGEAEGFYKILIDPETDRLLGAHLVRHNATEVINTLALAMKYQITANELADFMWAYPTSTSDLKYMVR
ncbi:dihydrolipoyl dehydrogenase family protein [Desulfogranum mediterraneum]|uniref:dihydrolipoyl dehydrogenase family protein n=1 Tax=Desulfogranum mediterraneum TaxID=160661 RepID=UPI000491C6DA|nr:NAD(P)/FAD-dependent oxidoreductase [Desulfogranum mediterraneum]